MDFVGKVCPYCKTAFTANDEVVICSVCEMPHHKDCWIENKACTTFGCTGTIVGADQYVNSVSNRMFCPKCGGAYNEGQKFCSTCGNVLNGGAVNSSYQYQQTQQQNYQQPYAQQGYQYQPQMQQPMYNQNMNGNFGAQTQLEPDLQMFIQKNQPFYIQKFQEMAMSNKNTSWNWSSFLFGAYWYMYRKMYSIAALYALISLGLGVIPGLGYILIIALWVCSGIFGNYFYKQYVDGELAVAKTMDQYNKNSYMLKKGGTSVGAVIGLMVIMFIVGIIL